MTGGLLRAQQLVELGRYAEARPLLEAQLAETPDDVALHGLLAQVHLGTEDLPAALAAGNRVVALRPDDEWGHRICAHALDRMKRPEEAVRAAAEAVRLAPWQWQTHQTYASCAVDARGLLVPAREAAERAVQLAPHEPNTHFTLGLVAQRQRYDDLARQAYQRTLALDPQHATALNNLTVLDGHRSLVKAARGYGTSLRHEPGHDLVQRNVEALAAVFVRRIYIAGLVVFLVGLGIAVASGGVTPASVALAVLLLAGTAAYVVHTARAVPVGVRRFVVTRLRRDRFLICTQVLTLAMVASALVVCLLPQGDVVGLALLKPLGYANIGLMVWSFARRS